MAPNLNGPQFKCPTNNNIDSGGRRPHNVMFANQFNRITGVKLRVFIKKVAEAII